jgi:adenosine deaminase
MWASRGVNIDFLSLPKAEIHIHLEGCFEVEDIVRRAKALNEPLPRPEKDLLKFEGIGTFLKFLDWICGLVRTPGELASAAYAFSRRMTESGAGYADVIVNTTHWPAWRHRIPAMIDALDAGFREAEEDGFAPVGLLISLLRQQSGEEAIELVDLLLQLKHPRVVALSIDGNETAAGRTGPRFAAAFQKAGAGGLKRAVHAGESSGPEGVWDAIELLGADRIDHGVRAIEDAKLVALLVERRIPLDICPASNLTLGLYPTLADHPFEKFRRLGIPVSVNTDDPALLNLKLPTEFARLAATFGWDRDIVRDVAANSIVSSFANHDIKRDLITRLAAWHAATPADAVTALPA